MVDHETIAQISGDDLNTVEDVSRKPVKVPPAVG